MKYSEMKYEQPDISKVGKKFTELLKSFKIAESFEEADLLMKKMTELMSDYQSMNVIASLNYSKDTGNKNFSKEQSYFDDNNPLFEKYKIDYYKILLRSKFRDEIEKKYGARLFKIAELAVKCFSPELTEDLQKENHLCSKYTRLKASARIMFDGKERGLQELDPSMESKDRAVRKQAYETFWKFFSDNAEAFDEIYDKLVFLRNKMAVKKGFNNFKELGYARMGRADYTEQMVNEFRNNVKKYFVPLMVKLREKQRIRLKLGSDKLKFYDQRLQFNSGNPEPKGNPEWIMNNAKTMFDELSPETSEFYDFMSRNELMDVYIRKGKAAAGFCDYIHKYKSPYIFTNMNGTSEDISILIHELGHAFQRYESRNFEVPEYIFPTEDACEIHSMSMEMFAYPWMNLFFKEDPKKFKYAHIVNSIDYFILYGVLVDEFQHRVYENPTASPDERKIIWRELERIYMPYIDYNGNEFLESGGRWQKALAIFKYPFYYIDYSLAQICAFQFWSKAFQEGDFKNSLKDYIKLCKAGGSKSFLELVKYANLESPFEESVIKKLAAELEAYLDGIDQF